MPRRPALREHAGEPEEQLGGLVEDPLQGLAVSLDVDQKVEEVNVVLPTYVLSMTTSASKSSIRRFVITEKAFSWLKVATTASTFKTLLRHFAKRALTPLSLNVKLGPRRKGHKGRAVWLA